MEVEFLSKQKENETDNSESKRETIRNTQRTTTTDDDDGTTHSMNASKEEEWIERKER